MDIGTLYPNKNKFYLNTIRHIGHLEPIMQYGTDNFSRSAIYQKAIDSYKTEIKLAVKQGEIIIEKDIITALVDGNFAAAKMLYEIGCSDSFTRDNFNRSLDALTIFALFNEGFYQAAEFLYDLVGLTPEKIDLNWLFMQPYFENFLKATPEAVFFLHKIEKWDNNMLFDYVSIIDLLKAEKKQDFNFMLSLNYPANKIDKYEIIKLFENENFDLLRTLFQNFEVKDMDNVYIPYDKVISLINQQRFEDAKFILDLGAYVDNSIIWNFFVGGNITAIELLAPYVSKIKPITVAAIAEKGYYDLAAQLISQGNLSISDMEQGFIEINFGANTIGKCLFQGNKEKAENLYKLGAPISNEMIFLKIEEREIEEAKFLMNLKGFTREEQEALLPLKTEIFEITAQQPELLQIEQAAEQANDAIDLNNFNKFQVNIHANNINITEAIKSVTYYEKSLNKAKIELSIENLEKATLFKPILIYYALMCLDQQNPIYFYELSSEYGKRMKHASGYAHYDGKIEIKSHSISQEVSEEITYNLFALVDKIKDINHAQLQDEVEAIITSHLEMKDQPNPKTALNDFIKTGLAGHDSGVLFHEITHQVMKKVFNSTNFNPYFVEDQASQDEYHQAICNTLTNIQTKFLPHHQVSLDACQDLCEFGRELKTTFFGVEIDDADNEIDFAQIIHGVGYFGKSILSYSALLSAFSTNLYSADTLDCEFIPRLPELELVYGSEDAISQSVNGRKHYCKYVLPEVLEAIKSHPLSSKIDLEPLGDFGCDQVFW